MELFPQNPIFILSVDCNFNFPNEYSEIVENRLSLTTCYGLDVKTGTPLMYVCYNKKLLLSMDTKQR